MTLPLPEFASAALLLDLDGTLIDLAATPDAVVVPAGLTNDLRAVRRQLRDALAIVTGRPIAAVDTLLAGAPFAIAGEHGGAIRPAPDAAIARPDLSPPPEHWIDAAAAFAQAHPGTLLERKARGFGLHFRQSPDTGPDTHALLMALAAGSLDFEVLQGAFLWEVRPRGIDKGHATVALMAVPPFLGRIPVFIGDDVTDEDGMRAAHALGGTGLRVQDWFVNAAGVRRWLRQTALRGDWGDFA